MPQLKATSHSDVQLTLGRDIGRSSHKNRIRKAVFSRKAIDNGVDAVLPKLDRRTSFGSVMGLAPLLPTFAEGLAYHSLALTSSSDH